MNYDFRNNWESIIVPHLRTKSIRKAIRTAIETYIREAEDHRGPDKYDPTLCPAEWSIGDSYWTHEHDFIDNKTEELIKAGMLRKPTKREKDPWSKKYDAYEEYINITMEPYVSHFRKYSLEAHQPYSTCHWWNRYFGIALAKIVLPEEVWIVIEGPIHTTVVNSERTRIFDILYYDENDCSLGGKDALKDALKNK